MCRCSLGLSLELKLGREQENGQEDWFVIRHIQRDRTGTTLNR